MKMEQILNKVHNVDPNNSEEVKDVISTFIQYLPKYKEVNSNRLLRELQIVINRFPKYCMKHRNNIETFLISFISSNNYFNVIEAAKCAHVLQQEFFKQKLERKLKQEVRPTQEKSATPKISWREQMNLLCYAAHKLIGSVFSDAVDLYRNNTKPQKSADSPMSLAFVEITKRKEDTSDRYVVQRIKLKNVLVFIQVMLVEIYPVAKPIQPQVILDMIVRVLSITSSVKQCDSDIASIKIEALRSLDAIIVCLGTNLIPYSALLFRLVLQTLRWSSDSTNDTSKIRCAAYRTLTNWLTTLHVYRLTDSRTTWEDELVTNILSDITPPKKLVQLTLGQQPSRHLSKKAKRKLATAQLQESTIAAYGPGENKIPLSEEVSDDIALAALECAETFLIVCGRFLKPATHKVLQERLVRECYNYTTYTDVRLLSLLRVLEATRKTVPNNVPPTTQYCLHLYSLLVNSKRAEISKFCSIALLDIRLHLHCSPPSLNFALEMPHETGNTKKTKIVSKRNRAMLEALLGADKVPTTDNEDEVISIPDEVPSKKLRLSEDIDKISVSSESISSVDISDDSDDDKVHEMQVVVDINESNKENDEEPLVIAEEEEAMEVYIEVQNIEQNHSTQELNTMEVERQIVCIENMVSDDGEVGKEPVKSIYEAQTQLFINASNDTVEEDRPLSLEIGYDYPNTGLEKVTVLEKIDDENLPSSTDTDDVQITCGQVVNNSPEIDVDKKSGEESKVEEIPKVNGMGENVVENGVSDETPIESTINETIKVSTKKDETSVEDMLADFVDEVNEEAAQT